MRITVRLFAVARDRVGQSSVDLELPPGSTVADVRAKLAGDYPPLAPILPAVRIAVAAEYAADDAPLTEGAELALIPPVSGG